jgi:hypothetical protein
MGPCLAFFGTLQRHVLTQGLLIKLGHVPDRWAICFQKLERSDMCAIFFKT